MKVVLERTRICVFPYKLGDSPTLERKLSVFDMGTREYKDRLFRYNNLTKTLYVPRGFGLNDMLTSLERDNIDIYKENLIDRSDEYIQPRNVKIIMRPNINIRDEHQEKSVEFLTTGDYAQRFLNIDTGFGKTFCTIKAASILNVPVMILVDTVALMLQWEKVIKEYTFCTNKHIISVQGRDIVNKIMKHKSDHSFYICSTHTISILAKEGDLDKFISHIKVGLKTTDEAHKLYVAVNEIDLACSIKYNFYLTATPKRSDVKEDIVYLNITKSIPKFGHYTTEINKYTHVKNVYINTYPSNWDQTRCKVQGQWFSALKYEEFVFRNPRRKLYFVLIAKRIVSKLLETDKSAKILILLAKNDHIKFMVETLQNHLNIDIGQFNSLIKNLELKKEELKKNVIISTVQSAGAGLDLKNLRAIIVFTPFRSSVTLHQLFGRLRKIDGKAVFYFNIIDEGFSDCVRQAKERMDFLRKKSQSMGNIEMPMNKVFNNDN
jgi:superfamily II DNA or RNA helicase